MSKRDELEQRVTLLEQWINDAVQRILELEKICRDNGLNARHLPPIVDIFAGEILPK